MARRSAFPDFRMETFLAPVLVLPEKDHDDDSIMKNKKKKGCRSRGSRRTGEVSECDLLTHKRKPRLVPWETVARDATVQALHINFQYLAQKMNDTGQGRSTTTAPEPLPPETNDAASTEPTFAIQPVAEAASRKLEDATTSPDDAASPLLNFIVHSSFLKRVSLEKNTRYRGTSLKARIFQALSDNRIGIVELHVHVQPPWEEWIHFLQTATSLRNLAIGSKWLLPEMSPGTVEQQSRVLEALTTNTTSLESLVILFQGRGPPPRPVNNVHLLLPHLHALPKLRKLVLPAGDDGVSVRLVALFVRNANSLTHLSLTSIRFGLGDFALFTESLRNSSETLVKLSLTECRFSFTAAHEFQESTYFMSKLRELKLLRNINLSGEAVAKIAMGSLIEGLELEMDQNCTADFFETLSVTASSSNSCSQSTSSPVPLLDLKVCVQSISDLGAMADYLTCCCHLRDLIVLVLANLRRKAYVPRVMRALKENGSVYSFKMISCFSTHPLDDSSLLRVEAYMTRNKCMETLLEKVVPREGAIGCNDGSKAADLRLLPRLLCAIQQAQRSPATTMLTGLIAANRSIGPDHRDTKRCIL